MIKPYLFNIYPQIKSISYDQGEILNSISRLYLSGSSFDLDVTYGKGVFYRDLPAARYKFDINPSAPEIIPGDAKHIPLKDGCISSAIFDPPFLPGDGEGGLMIRRYSHCGTMQNVWDLYRQGIKELIRVTASGAIIVVKCQDCLNARSQYMTHLEVGNYAIENGLYPIDIFILLARSRPRAWNHKNQNHARKFHSYFWVFKKANRNIPYSMARGLKK